MDLQILTEIERHFANNHELNAKNTEKMADAFAMACLRNKVDSISLIYDINNGDVFNCSEFISKKTGNIYAFVDPKYVGVAKRLSNITIGGNGGMASIGRGEWLIAILTQVEQAALIKNGKGDILYNNSTTEEIKFNGGKIFVDDSSGKSIHQKFMNIINERNEMALLKGDNKWVPFRKKDKKKFTVDEIGKLNARFWEAISGNKTDALTDDNFIKVMAKQAFDRVFEKSNTLMVCEENGNFIRFKTTEEALEFYLYKKEKLEFEIRASQSNPVAIYMWYDKFKN